MTASINTIAYSPGTALDEELADLGYAAMCGWPDQRPVTSALVRSRLRPSGNAQPTTVLLARLGDGTLAAAAALRYAAGPGSSARLWGPIVAPDCQKRGLGTALLQQATALQPDGQTILLTAEIPEARKHGYEFFEKAGWQPRSTAALLKADLGSLPPLLDRDWVRVRRAEAADADADALSRLYQALHPDHGRQIAQDTYRRWSADERFVSDGLLIVDGPGGDLYGAALMYPLAHDDPAEPAEALLADVLISPDIDRTEVAPPLIAAALTAGVRHHAVVARAIVPDSDPALRADLRSVGLAPAGQIRYFQAPAGPIRRGP
ncbi:GNAT family N-acetyltransferase [Herbidospora cretacea]|uniref:GNAT family N-acetyltransferase n=1 Tax=Herbidospora cretacea TaxID=28444 RepID=UPI000773CC88|nr:GNAT family N-acetyltransferase [Herbidospora cretacea]